MRQFFMSLSVTIAMCASISLSPAVFEASGGKEQSKEQGKDAARPQDNEEDISERFRGYYSKDTGNGEYGLLVSEVGDLVIGKLLRANGGWDFRGIIVNDKLEFKTLNDQTKIPCLLTLSREPGKINVEIVPDAVDDKTAPPKPIKITFRKPSGPSDPLIGIWRNKMITLIVIGAGNNYQMTYFKGDKVLTAPGERRSDMIVGKIKLDGEEKSEFFFEYDNNRLFFKVGEDSHFLYEGLLPDDEVVNPFSEEGKPLPSTASTSDAAAITSGEANRKHPSVGIWRNDKVTLVIKGGPEKLTGTVSKDGATYFLRGKAVEDGILGYFVAGNAKFDFVLAREKGVYQFMSGLEAYALHK